MRTRRNLVPTAILALAVTVAGAGCGDDETPRASDGGGDGGGVLVLAAASLTDAFTEMAAAFEAANPGIDVELSLAGSSALREQILEGAPADVFASANMDNMDQLVQAGAVDGSPEVFAHNQLQIAVPAGNPGEVAGLEDFSRDELLVGLCAEGVPCGDFGRRALEVAGVEPALDTNEPDVRALLTKIEAGELDAGLVYVTDVAAAGDRVEGIDIPSAANVEAEYPIAALADGPDPEEAAAFVAFVLSDEGQAILAGHGFTRADSTGADS